MGNKKVVLIVDDNSQNLRVLGNILKENGLSPAFAKNGVKGLNSAKKKLPDLILLDIMMPEMNGFEVCEKLKQYPTTKDIPVIFLTAKTEKEDIIKGLEQGAVDYVTKPFNTKELMTRVNTHLELKSAKEELRQALAAKDKFFSIITHDLMNPLSALVDLSKILAKEQDENEKNELTKLVQQSSKQAYNLLENLLEWSRSQTGRIQINPGKLNLKFLVDMNIKLLESQAKAKNITVFSSVEITSIFADEHTLATVIRNLLSNAIKFTKPFGKVEIGTKEEDNFVEISVSDTGIGIKSTDVNKLFQIDVPHTTRGTAKEEGTGLGLILCKEFIEKNRGSIGIESELGKGSRFYIRLPKKTEQ
ncbi:hybrid sensor histidine kinase/response regulator [Candidatus Parabeggiatoa sp. HSG14]|uniref:hybrid sensor histidine kinase/response regulator n=1 Tax=Candidatus Parabeggiatoa sp. HSG14 TaxID=3055593 RepID=UPI0025A78A13|nr:hybrid sensor histidine kinase/response regulator [Thiotrichales bacterium HSG14]